MEKAHTMASPEMVKRAVKADLKGKGLTIIDAAKAIGVTPESLRTTLSRYSNYFGGSTAAKLVAEYGYTFEFLQAGRGYLYPGGPGSGRTGAAPADPLPERSLLAVCADLSTQLGELSERVGRLENLVRGGGVQIADFQAVAIPCGRLSLVIFRKNAVSGAFKTWAA